LHQYQGAGECQKTNGATPVDHRLLPEKMAAIQETNSGAYRERNRRQYNQDVHKHLHGKISSPLHTKQLQASLPALCTYIYIIVQMRVERRDVEDIHPNPGIWIQQVDRSTGS
jgi:hypothetical protein